MIVSKGQIRTFLIIIFTFLVLIAHTSWINRIINDAIFYAGQIGILVAIFLVSRKPVSLTRRNIPILLGSLFFAAWIFLQGLLLTPEEIVGLTSTTLGIVVTAVGAGFFIRRSDTPTVLKTLIYTVVFLTCSQVISYTLILAGFEQSILIMEVNTGAVFGEQAALIQPLRWYFPATFSAHIARFIPGGPVYPRSIGLWREPGIYQLMVVISFFALDFVEIKRKNLYRGLFLFSLFTIASTAGFINLLVCLLFKYIINNKLSFRQFAGVILVIVLGLSFYFSPGTFGLRTKLSNVSGEARTSAIGASFEAMIDTMPVGYGLRSQFDLDGAGQAINLLSSVHKLGLIGVLSYVCLLVLAYHQNSNKYSVILFIPILMTMLFSQPIYADDIVFLMLLLPAKSLYPVLKQKRQTASSLATPAPIPQ